MEKYLKKCNLSKKMYNTTFFKRLSSLLLSVVICLGTLPYDAFAELGNNETIIAITMPDKTEYTVDNGTELVDIGMPSVLTGTISRPLSDNNEELATNNEEIEVEWVGEYNANLAGQYMLTAKLKREIATGSDVVMPVITVNVLEPTIKNETNDETGIIAEDKTTLSIEAQNFINEVNLLDKDDILAAMKDWESDKENELFNSSKNKYIESISKLDEMYSALSNSEQLNPEVVKAYTVFSQIYQYRIPNMNNVAMLNMNDYNFNITYNHDIVVPTNTLINFLDGIVLIVKHIDGTPITENEKNNYQVRIKSVTSSDNSYTWNNNDTSITTSTIDGVSYNLSFGVWNLKDSVWVQNINGGSDNYEKKLTVKNDTVIKDNLSSDDQYITNARIAKYITGTEPFDSNDDSGNDSNSNNNIIRTFDTINYTLSIDSQSYDSGNYYKKGYVGIRVVLPFTNDKAEFDISSMGWLVQKTNTKYDYKIETKDINGVPSQVLTGYRFLDADKLSVSNAFPLSNLQVNLAIKVKLMGNNQEVIPDVYVWCDNNDIDFDNIDHVCTNDINHQNKPNKGKELVKINIDPIKVSATPRYNVLLEQGSSLYCDGVDNFDFANTGNSLAINKEKGNIYGRIVPYAVTLQIYNNATNKGLRGIELPDGSDITFDVAFSESYKPNGSNAIDLDLTGTDSKYTPLVWSYEGFSGNNTTKTQEDGRDVSKYGFTYMPGLSAFNTGGNVTGKLPAAGSNRCADGGKWNAVQNGNKVQFTVSEYKINPDWFPNARTGVNPTQDNTYFKLENGVENAYIGCFSAGEMYVVVPFGGNGDKTDVDYLASKYKPGTIQLTVSNKNLKARSISGQSLPVVNDNSNQTKEDDDTKVSTIYLSRPGSYENRIQYSNKGTDLSDIQIKLENNNNGKDTASIGQFFTIKWGGYTEPKGELVNSLYGLNSLMKFDNKALTISGIPQPLKYAPFDENATSKFLYGAKKDKSGWVNDKEMDGAVETDLIYFSSLKELETAGYICVAVLMEYRSDSPTISSAYAIGKIPMMVKNDYTLGGYIAQTVITSTVWTKAAYESVSGIIPSRLDVQNNNATMPNIEFLKNFRTNSYKKAMYDNSGNYIGGHAGEANIGDSVYIVPYKAEISKFILQKNSDNSTKNLFNLDDAQVQVDFKLDMNLKQTIKTSEVRKTTVTIIDTLPDGVIYNKDVAFGGSFVLNNPSGGGYKGTLTGGTSVGNIDINGIEFESATLGINSDGKNILTFVFNNVPIGTNNLPSIYYSITIDTAAAKNAQQYLNKASITTIEDNRAILASNGNYTEAGFSVAKNSSMSLNKISNNKFINNNENAKFTLTWQNTGKNDVSNSPMMDTMPINEDENGSKYSGSYTLESINLINNNGSINNFANLEVWYTLDKSATGKYSKDYNDISIRNTWSKATVDANGLVTGFPKDGVTAWCILGKVKASSMIQASCTIRPNGAKPNDVYVNSISLGSAKGTAITSVVSREISGLTWLDANKDGNRQDNESRITGITARLVNKDDYQRDGDKAIAITNLSGKICEMETDSLGEYKFIDLPAGEFIVLFLDGKTLLSKYTMTMTKAAGVNANINSDATPVTEDGNTTGILKSGFIPDIKMPETKDIKTSPYVISRLDAGFYQVTTPFNFIKVNNNKIGLKGAEFKLYDLTCTDNHVHEYKCYTAIKVNGIDKIWSSADDGLVNFGELYNGTYLLEEIKAPIGYQKPSGYWKVVVNSINEENPIDISALDKAPLFDKKNKVYMLYNDEINNGGGGETTINPYTITLRAEKFFDGIPAKGNKFNFILKDSNGNIIQTKNNTNENIIFDELTFEKEGTYIYNISELLGIDKEIDYDKSVYKVTIKVNLSDGTYIGNVLYEKDSVKYNGIPIFKNISKTTPSKNVPNPNGPNETSLEDEDVPRFSGPNETSLEDEDVPRSNGPNETSLEDEDVPRFSGPNETSLEDDTDKITPQTGDNTQSQLWIMIMILSLFGIIYIFKSEKNKKRKI